MVHEDLSIVEAFELISELAVRLHFYRVIYNRNNHIVYSQFL